MVRFIVLIACCALLSCSACAFDIEVSLDAAHTGIAIPVSAEVPPGNWQLEDSSGKAVPCQMNRETGRLSFLVETPVSSRPVKKLFKLRPGIRTEPDRVRVKHADRKEFAVLDGGQPVFVYNYRTMTHEEYPAHARSCYIHPLYDLQGNVLTDDFAEGHPHHRGIAWMFPQVSTADNRFDHWHLRGIRTRFGRVLAMESGPVLGVLSMANSWRQTADEKPVLDETITIRVYAARMGGRIIDFDTVLSAREEIIIGPSGAGYGGFNFRIAPREDTVLWTSDGRLEADVNRERFYWADLSGKFGNSGGMTGAAIFDHPENRVHPTGWSLRYYGILNPSFAGIEPQTLNPGSPLRVRYRMWIHDGDADSGNVARAYHAFMNPPEVRVIKGD